MLSASIVFGAVGVPLAPQTEPMAALAPLDLSFYHRTETLLGRLAQMAQADQCGRRMTMENLHDAQDPSFQMPVVTFGEDTAQTPHRTAKVQLPPTSALRSSFTRTASSEHCRQTGAA